jgi:hypothetical protein
LLEETPVTHDLVVDTMKGAADTLLDIASHLIRIAADAKA